MKHKTFKTRVSNGLQFYFRPQHDGENELYYQIDGYQNKIKFKMIKVDEVDKVGERENAEWQISIDSNVPKEIRELELDFNDAIVSDGI